MTPVVTIISLCSDSFNSTVYPGNTSRCSYFFRSSTAFSTFSNKYILSTRIRNAQILLETTDYNISNIASMVGYENAFYFSRLFKKEKGLSPAAYRKIFREKYHENL